MKYGTFISFSNVYKYMMEKQMRTDELLTSIDAWTKIDDDGDDAV